MASLTSILTGHGYLNQLGSGTTILTGNNSGFSGLATIVSGGTLQVGNGSSNGNIGAASVTNNGTLAFDLSNTLLLSNAVSGTGQLNQIGTGTLTIATNETYSGATLITNGGTIVAANTNALVPAP